ncbi:MAG: hypothetical protein WCO69_00715, partial [Candidatus Omnitrophota bacterium]
GNWNVTGGTFTPGVNTVTFTKGAGTQTLNSGDQNFYNITHSGSGTLQLLSDVSLDGNWSMLSGSFAPGARAVIFTGSGVQGLSSGGQSFYDLVHSGSGTLQLLGGPLTVTHQLRNLSGTLALNGRDWTMTGASFINQGTLSLFGSEVITGLTQDASGGSWRYTGDGANHSYSIKGYDYYNLIIDAAAPLADSFRLDAPLKVNRGLSILAGELDSNGFDINVGGNWNNQARFNARTGMVTLDGTDQAVLGSTTFYDLTRTVLLKDALTFEAGQTQTITGALVLKGTFGGILSLRSTAPGTQWRIDPQGARNVVFVDIQDSRNINSEIIDCSRNSFNSGNNWGYSILSLGDDPLAMWNLNLIQSTESQSFVPYNYIFGSALTNGLDLLSFSGMFVMDQIFGWMEVSEPSSSETDHEKKLRKPRPEKRSMPLLNTGKTKLPLRLPPAPFALPPFFKPY